MISCIFALLCSEQEDESRKHFQWQKNPSIKGTVAQEMTMKDLQFTIPYCGTNDEACLVIRHHQGQQVENFWSNLVLEPLLRWGSRSSWRSWRSASRCLSPSGRLSSPPPRVSRRFCLFYVLLQSELSSWLSSPRPYLTALCCSGVIVVTMISFVGKVTRAFHANTFPIDNRQLA